MSTPAPPSSFLPLPFLNHGQHADLMSCKWSCSLIPAGDPLLRWLSVWAAALCHIARRPRMFSRGNVTALIVTVSKCTWNIRELKMCFFWNWQLERSSWKLGNSSKMLKETYQFIWLALNRAYDLYQWMGIPLCGLSQSAMLNAFAFLVFIPLSGCLASLICFFFFNSPGRQLVTIYSAFALMLFFCFF